MSGSTDTIGPEHLGSAEFLRDHRVKYAYAAGAMVKGIASVEMVVRMGKAGLLSFYGSGGQRLEVLQRAIADMVRRLGAGEPFGVNLLHNILMPEIEERTVDLLLAHGVREVEAAAFVDMTPALVRWRLTGLRRGADGRVIAANRVMGKASRLEVAQRFLSPAPEGIVRALRQGNRISEVEAALGREIPMADDVCAEADSGGHTDRRTAFTLIPSFLRLRDELALPRAEPVRIGAAGGLGTPEAIAAAFMLGADFVLTGSINQCTVEAGTSEAVKDLLASAEEQDVDMAPAGDMFEIGAKVQVLKRGVLFPARAGKLYELYRRFDAIDQLDDKTRRMIEDRYFGRSFDEVWAETREYYRKTAPAEIDKAEANPKQKMAMIFRWYFVHSNRLALAGDPDKRVDFQIHCGPAMGAFNRWVRGTPWADWRNRHVDEIADRLMREAAGVFSRRLGQARRRSQERQT